MNGVGGQHARVLHFLMESATDYAICTLDLDGRIVMWNSGAEHQEGYSRRDIEGQSFECFFTPEDRRDGVPAKLLAKARLNGRVESEGWRIRKDGSLLWAASSLHAVRDEAGTHIGYAQITRDMTAQREAQQALIDSERRFRLLVQGVVDYAIYMLDPNGIVTNWNAGAQHIKGYAAEEIIGQHFSRFYTETERAAGVPMRALQIAAEAGRYESEGWRVRKDGSLFWASAVLDAIWDGEGRLIGYAKITRDITDKRAAQIELQRAHEQLAQAQKMEALGQLTGGVAHDFNNLLMVVTGQAQLLRRSLVDNPRAERALDAIELAARRGEDLTRRLLSFARRQHLTPVSVSLTERADVLGELLATSLPANVRLSVDLPATLWPVTVDLGELELALLNLAFNARDAMPEGGALTISAKNQALPTEAAASDLSGDFVALSVADTGHGIPGDILPRVFDPFFTTKEVSKGTGLGLSQVYGFAQQSGGRIVAESELNRGTRFTLFLPRAGSEPMVSTPNHPPRTDASADVLLVEDNPEVAEVAAGMLEQLGHRVRLATGAAGAIEVLRMGPRPDLVLSDIMMAGDLDGLGLARRLRQEAPGVPVLLATGYSQAAERLAGEFPVLRKPYNLLELSQALASAIADVESRKLVRLESARRDRAVRRRRSR